MKKEEKAKGINLPEIDIGPREPQLPVNVFPITATDVVEVIARGITSYMNERLTKFHAIAYNPENIALRKELADMVDDLRRAKEANARLTEQVARLQSENERLAKAREKGADTLREELEALLAKKSTPKAKPRRR